MEASGLIKVLMVTFLIFGDGHPDRVLAEDISMRECETAQKAAVDFNNRFRWFWDNNNMEIVVLCRVHPDNREA